MRKLFKAWMPDPTQDRDIPGLPSCLAFPRDPRLWRLRRHSVALGAGIGALASVIPLPIQIPAAALLYRSGGPQVAVVEPTGAVSFRDVAIASDDGNVVSIGSGLSIGDKVALNLSSQIAAGAKVRPNADDTKSASVQKPVH